MNLKLKLTSTVAAFFLILGLVVMGVFALPTVNVSLKGSLTFNATNVSATVSGTIANTKAETQPTLTPLTYKAEYTDEEQTALDNAEKEWEDCDLTFKDDGSAIVITLTITNNATDRPLYASVNKDFSCNFENVKVSMKNKAREGTEETDTAYQGTTIEIPADKDDNLNFVNIEISMEVSNKNTSLSKDATYGFKVLLNDQAVEQEKLHYDFLTVDGKNIATVSMVSPEVTTGDIIIPETVINPETQQPHTVTTVADFAFIDQVKFGQAMTDPRKPNFTILSTAGAPITSIVLPETITRIGFAAFGANMQLESINIPSTVTELGDMAFALTSTLKAIEIINMPTITNIRLDVPLVFLGSGIESVKIENGDIPAYMIQVVTGYPTSLKTVVLGDRVTSIGSFAFYGCSSLSSIDLSNVTSIGRSAFSGCSSLSSINLSNVTSIGNQAFSGCSSLSSIDLSNVTSIGDQAFDGCSGLTGNIDLSNCTSIGKYAFSGCSSLSSIDLSNVTSIGDLAFYGCSSLSSVTIGENCTVVGSNAFSGCDNISFVEYNNGKYLTDSTGKKTVIMDVVDTNITNFTLPTECKIIYDSAFQGCTNLNSIDLSNVTSIGLWAFQNCSSLSSVNLSKVQNLEGQVFSGCTGLSTPGSIIVGSEITSIESTSVPTNVCTKVDGVYYLQDKDGVNRYLIQAESTSIQSHTVDTNCTVIADLAFSGCSSLSSIDLSNVTSVGNSAFSGCSSLSGSLDLSKVTSIGDNVFNGCSSLSSINLSKVTSIGYQVFNGCSSLSSIDLSNVTRLGWNAFSGCSGLTSITLSNKCTSIDIRAFSNCPTTMSVTFKGTQEEWTALVVTPGVKVLKDITPTYVNE